MTVTSASSPERLEPRTRNRRSGAATTAALLALALGSACSGGGGGSSPGAPAAGGGASGGPPGGVSGNANGQSGTPATGQGGTSGAAQGGNGPGGSSGASAGSAGVSSGAGGGGTAGQGGSAGSAGGASGGSAGSGMGVPDAGACCKTADCQPDAVKTCVCTQWQQGQCCTDKWDTFCQTTAEEKCQAEKCATDPSPLTPDGGNIVKGACCATHTTPGCDDSAVETCICALLSDCCTKQWDSVCVQLVREKHCEDGVRTCVCDQWQQSSCCDTQWTNACGLIAESKCGAQPSCP